MKAMIYAGIGLFSVATVYGLTDYYNSEKSGELKKLYTEENVQPPAPVAEEKTVEVAPVKNVEVAPAETRVVKAKSPKKVKKAKKTLRFENFSRGRIVERVVADTIKVVQSKQPE